MDSLEAIPSSAVQLYLTQTFGGGSRCLSPLTNTSWCLCPRKLRNTSQRSCWNFSFLLPFFGLCFSSRDVKLNVKKPKSSFGCNHCHLELAQLWQPIFWIQSQTRHSPVDSNSTGKLIQTEIFLRTCFWFQSNDQLAARLNWPVHVFQDLWIG